MSRARWVMTGEPGYGDGHAKQCAGEEQRRQFDERLARFRAADPRPRVRHMCRCPPGPDACAEARSNDHEEQKEPRVSEVGKHAEPRAVDRPTPAEVAATIFKGLGLDPHKELPGPQGRPIPLADFNAQPIGELF